MKRLFNWLADATGIRVLPDPLPHPKDRSVETLKLPGYYQTQAHTCGFAAGLTILRYFRPGFPAEKFYQCIRPHARLGVSRRRLMDALRASGLRVRRRTDLDFSAITDSIDSGRPIAVVVHTRDADAKHWVVIYGYGRRPNRLYVTANGRPFFGKREYPYGIFRMHFLVDPGFGLVCAGMKERTRGGP